jgi:lipopolysaccharide export system protein LptC
MVENRYLAEVGRDHFLTAQDRHIQSENDRINSTDPVSIMTARTKRSAKVAAADVEIGEVRIPYVEIFS